MTVPGPGRGGPGAGGHDEGAGGDGEEAAHLDAMSEVEAEAEAEVPEVEIDLAHPIHPHVADDSLPLGRDAAGDDADGTTVTDDRWSGPMPNHHVGRQRVLVLYLRIALVLAFVVGVVELVIPERHRDAAGAVMVAVFVVVPLGRVLWLMVRWQRRGDWRFALVGLVLLAVVFTGLVAR